MQDFLYLPLYVQALFACQVLLTTVIIVVGIKSTINNLTKTS